MWNGEPAVIRHELSDKAINMTIMNNDKSKFKYSKKLIGYKNRGKGFR